MVSWGTVKPNTGQNEFKPTDLYEPWTVTENFKNFRFLGPIAAVCTHTMKIMSPKQKKEVSIFKTCLNFNPLTQEFEDNGCPYCNNDVEHFVRYHGNVIDRDLQLAEPRRREPYLESEQKIVNIGTKDDPYKARVKSKGSKCWTPIRMFSLPAKQVAILSAYNDTNKHIIKDSNGRREEAFEISHPKYGVDIQIRYVKKGNGFGDYFYEKGSRTPLTKEERGLPVWPLTLHRPPSLSEAQKNWKGLQKILIKDSAKNEDESDSYSDDPFASDEKPRKRKSKRSDQDAFDDLDKELSTRKRRRSKAEKSSGSKTRSGSSPRRKKRRSDDIPF